MTPDKLRAEAEKLASSFMQAGDCQCTYCVPKRAKITDALLDFATRHGERERLRGRIEGMEASLHGQPRWMLQDLRFQLAAMEKGEEVAR